MGLIVIEMLSTGGMTNGKEADCGKDQRGRFILRRWRPDEGADKRGTECRCWYRC